MIIGFENLGPTGSSGATVAQIELGAVIVAAYGRSGTHYASERALRSPRFGDEMRVLRQFLMGKGGRDRRQIVCAGVG